MSKKFSFHLPKRKAKAKERREFDARRYWIILLCGTVALLSAELLYFSWHFQKVTDLLDTPPVPSLETNATAISAMKKDIAAVKDAIAERTGTPLSSQNNSEVVE